MNLNADTKMQKKHGCDLSSSIQGFFLLNQCQLSDDYKNLIKATITELTFEHMKTKLLKVFGSSERSIDSRKEEMNIKIEDVNVVDDEETFYGHYSGRGFRDGASNSRYSRGSYASGARGGRTMPRKFNFSSGYRRGNGGNPNDRFKKTRCSVCESTYHNFYDCPERSYYAEDQEENHEVVLYQSNLVTEEDYRIFTAESSVSAILDSGASSTVAGEAWFNGYYDGLSEDQQKTLVYEDSSSTYKFGSDQRFPSLFKVAIPAKIGNTQVKILTDVVKTTVPLLLSKDAMKKAGTKIDFVNDQVTMFGEKQMVKLTQSGHYAVALNETSNILDSVCANDNVNITLIASYKYFVL